jgi:predicted nucleotidyltransferase component of viral defense system
MADKPVNLSAPVKQRLLNIARAQGQVFDVVLVRFALERLLYRLSISEYRDRFILKGGMLVTMWVDDDNRVTRDCDFLGRGDSSEDALRKALQRSWRSMAKTGSVLTWIGSV